MVRRGGVGGGGYSGSEVVYFNLYWFLARAIHVQ